MAQAPKSLLKLPQRQETWYLAVRQLRIWITPPDEAPNRPYGILIANLDQGTIQGLETCPSQPTPDQVTETLFDAIKNPLLGSPGSPHRPEQICFEDNNLMDAVASALEEINVSFVFQPMEEIADEILSEMATQMVGGAATVQGLLSQEGVTPEQIEALFEAAAEYYHSAPWVHLTNMQALAIQVTPETKPRYAVVMGNGGVEYGLVMYKQWDDFLLQFGLADHPMEMVPQEGSHSLFFGDITLVPFDDLDAIEAYGWEVADEEAYPIPAVFTQDGEADRPDRADLHWYEAAMRTIQEFVPAHLNANDQGDYHPARAEFSIPTFAGVQKVIVEYPAGELPVDTRPVEMSNWGELEDDDDDFDIPINFDRRAMEGSMSLFGNSFDDPQERQAQEIMYEAWEEQNPARRINLAHQAIAISPNCADAYVLLAEEGADTLGRALDYYQMGVEAGERALGESFFVENEGYFWGLLETRPYMRARAGLANMLWEMMKREDAMTHFRELLRLNPGDNQGIRYSLLHLLLELNRNAEVDALLNEYEDDWSAEWCYTQALRAFQKEGDSPAAHEALKDAQEQNPYVPNYLIGATRIPGRLPDMISLGRESEATHYASAYLNFWRKTRGAVAWLTEQTQPSTEKQKIKTRRGRRGKKH